jgi:hypothetical protein
MLDHPLSAVGHLPKIGIRPTIDGRRNGALIGNPFVYRDSRTDGMLEEAFRRIPHEQLFEMTGNQFMYINTLFQLLSISSLEAKSLGMRLTLDSWQ